MIKELQKFDGDLDVYFFKPLSESSSWTELERDLYPMNPPFYLSNDGSKLIIED